VHLRLRRIVYGTLAAGLLSGVLRAEVEVIYDSGMTEPLAPYLEAFGEAPAAGRIEGQHRPTGELGVADVTRLLPIRSPGLTPGPVTRRPVTLPNNGTLTQPFFLLGSDEKSRAWLVAHRGRLEAIGAVGMLVQAESVADLEAIAALAGGLPILPAPASDIARSLGIRHFPVLISRFGLEQ
jgi:integrating conjugative element protein (TIGR03765 family)